MHVSSRWFIIDNQVAMATAHQTTLIPSPQTHAHAVYTHSQTHLISPAQLGISQALSWEWQVRATTWSPKKKKEKLFLLRQNMWHLWLGCFCSSSSEINLWHARHQFDPDFWSPLVSSHIWSKWAWQGVFITLNSSKHHPCVPLAALRGVENGVYK